MKLRTSSGFECSNTGDVQNSMRRLAVPRLPLGTMPENGVRDVVKGGGIRTFKCFTWSRTVRGRKDCSRYMAAGMR